MSGVRIAGVVLAVLGCLAAIFPGWFAPLTGGSEPPVEVFGAIERRVRGGMVLGVGLVLLAVNSLRPWSVSIPAAIFYFMAGALATRLFAMVLYGASMEAAVAKQWLLVAIETVAMTVAALWLWRTMTGPGE